MGAFYLWRDAHAICQETDSQRTESGILQCAEALIEQMLDWSENTVKPNLTQIEDMALDLRQQFGQALSENEIAAQENVAPIALPNCSQCDKAMRPKGPKPKTVLTRVGELKLQRSLFSRVDQILFSGYEFEQSQ